MNARRSEYLAALGLTAWTIRRAAPRESAATARSPGLAAAPAEVAPDAAPDRAAAPAVAAVARPAGVPPRASRASPAASVGGLAREAGMDWAGLAARVAACTRCPLSATRTQTVFGVGDRQAEWMIVGEAPGAEEDLRGEPFVGRAGQLLNSMLRAVGLTRERVYIANVLKCRPPQNRDPLAAEADECLPYLERQIELLSPGLILVVGRIASQNLLRTDARIGSLRLRKHEFGASRVPLVVTYHPAYLLRSPREKSKAWEDLQFARAVLAQHGDGRSEAHG